MYEPRLEPPEDTRRITAHCDCCGDDILEGETMYSLFEYTLCESCIEAAKTDAPDFEDLDPRNEYERED